MSKNYLNRKEVAAYFNVNPATVHRWKTELGCPSIKLATGRVVYDLEKVEAWLFRRQNN